MFYLTVEELFAFVEGRAVTNDLSGLVELRRSEYNRYRKVHKIDAVDKNSFEAVLCLKFALYVELLPYQQVKKPFSSMPMD